MFLEITCFIFWRERLNFYILFLAEIVQLVKDVSSEYIGSHNFHNFTSGKKFTDPSARRYMFSIDVSLFE
jgi:tRNA U38,U39,U40 pseudouridine synthase TruA